MYSRSEIFTLVKSLEDLGKYGRDFQALVRSKFSASQIGHVFKVLVIKLLVTLKVLWHYCQRFLYSHHQAFMSPQFRAVLRLPSYPYTEGNP